MPRRAITIHHSPADGEPSAGSAPASAATGPTAPPPDPGAAVAICELAVRDFLDGTPDGFVLLGPGLKVHAINTRAEQILGLLDPEGGDDFSSLWPVLAGTDFEAFLRESLDSTPEPVPGPDGDDRPTSHETHLERDRRWIEARTKRCRGLLHVHLRDITYRKRAEAELQRYARDLLTAKAAMERQAEELAEVNRALKDARESADLARHQAEQARLQAEQARSLAEFAREQAEAASSSKSMFLANMSHEIRTPMTAIVGFADMMLEPGQGEDQRRDCLQTIRRNARHLLELINDILDISKIEAGKMTVERLPVELPRVVAEVVSMMRPRCLEKGLDFQLHFDGPVRKTVMTDPLRLKQILVNLVGNAVKFTPAGMVMLRISCPPARNGAASTDPDANPIRFEVIDSGVGIDRENLPRLFQPFVQADGSMTRRFGGTGLGLTISKRLARMLGGDISVVSESGRGSTFRVDIDAGSEEQGMITQTSEVEIPSVTPIPGPSSLAGLNLLLVEDGKDNQRLIRSYLERAGARVTVADNGRLALEAVSIELRQADGMPAEAAGGMAGATGVGSGGGFDLILMDMQMPELDGYGAASELRRRGVSTPIVALTAHAMADDRTKCLAAGCSEYLTKPIDRNQLLRMIADLTAAHRAGAIDRATDRATDRAIDRATAGPTAVTPNPTLPNPAAFAPTRDQVTPPEHEADAHEAGAPEAVAPEAGSPEAHSPEVVSEFADDPDFAELLEGFVANLPGTVGVILAEHAARNAEGLRRRLHQLKGSGGGFGFPQLTTLAGAAEHAVRDGAPDLASHLHLLVSACRRVRGYDRAAESGVAGGVRKSA